MLVRVFKFATGSRRAHQPAGRARQMAAPGERSARLHFSQHCSRQLALADHTIERDRVSSRGLSGLLVLVVADGYWLTGACLTSGGSRSAETIEHADRSGRPADAGRGKWQKIVPIACAETRSSPAISTRVGLSSPAAKNFLVSYFQKLWLYHAIPPHHGGALRAIVTTREAGRRWPRTSEALFECGRTVLCGR